jgi:hypothetical protein
MPSLTGVLSQLQAEREKMLKEVSKLEQAIGVLRGLNHTTGSPSGRSPSRMSLAARRRIAAAQRVRWAKWKAAQKKAA